MSKKRILYLIRHAQSKYNYEEALEIQNKGNPLEVNFRRHLTDANLTEYGISQALNASKIASELDVTTVLVSPLQRALETAHYMFQGHKKQPKLKVFPLIRERTGATCDIPEEIHKVHHKFKHFDFSVLLGMENPELYFFHTMKDEDLRDKLLSEYLHKKQQATENCISPTSYLVDTLIKLQEDLETRKGMKKRVEEVRRYLIDGFGENEKLALVSHGSFLKAFTATKYQENGYAIDGHLFENCEILEYEMVSF